jgi:tetratricopeptide (TPR) repeat protein
VKYAHTGNIEDLSNAVSSLEQALTKSSPKNTERSYILNNLGTCVNLRYDRTSMSEDLEKAIHYYEMALAITPSHSIERVDILNNLGTSYRKRYAFVQDHYQPDSEISSVILTNKQLTPRFLSKVVTPYLNAVVDIQHIIDEIKGRDKRDVLIKSISQNSPISVNLEGAAEALQQIKDSVVPWRRKHSEKMAILLEREKQAEIGARKAEILEKRALAAKGQAEAKKITAEAAKQHAETEKLRLENEILRLELHRAKIQLALDVLAQVAPNLSEPEKIAYVVRLLPPLDILVSSELELETER